MSQPARPPGHEPELTLEELRAERRRLRAKLQVQGLKNLQRLTESYSLYGDGWDSLVDSREALRGDQEFRPASSTMSLPTDRSHGRNWPLWQNLTDLNRFRQASRVLCDLNSQAKGVLANMTNFLIGTGYKYQVAPKDKALPDADAGKPGRQPPSPVDGWVEAVQAVVDRVTGELHSAFCAPWVVFERETYRRRKRDGEAFVRFHQMPDGTTQIRFIEPECVIDPPSPQSQAGWSYGLRHRVEYLPDGSLCEDVATVEALYACYTGDPGRGETVPAAKFLHLKNTDTDSTVKRGTPSFFGDVWDAFDRAGTLQRYISVSSKVQAATAEIQQFESATKGDVQRFANDQKYDTRTNARSGQEESLEHRPPGMVRRVPRGMTFVPPPTAGNIEQHLAVVQADLRCALAAFCAPEYFTADASNANYASTKEAGAPFVRAAQTEQEEMVRFFKAVVWRCVLWYAECRPHELPPEALAAVELQVEAPKVLIKDPLEQAQTDQILVGLGAKDQDTVSMEWGYDPETVQANLQAHQERNGPPMPLLPGPGEDDGPPQPGTPPRQPPAGAPRSVPKPATTKAPPTTPAPPTSG